MVPKNLQLRKQIKRTLGAPIILTREIWIKVGLVVFACRPTLSPHYVRDEAGANWPNNSEQTSTK